MRLRAIKRLLRGIRKSACDQQPAYRRVERARRAHRLLAAEGEILYKWNEVGIGARAAARSSIKLRESKKTILKEDDWKEESDCLTPPMSISDGPY